MNLNFDSIIRYARDSNEAILYLIAIYHSVKNFLKTHKDEQIVSMYLEEELEDVISLVIETNKNRYSTVIKDSDTFLISLDNVDFSYFVED